LAKQAYKLILRDNSGLDFGAYKDATLYLLKDHRMERLIYLNDSVYYFRRGLTEFVRRLAFSKADICSGFENFETSHHIQSFSMSFGPLIMTDERFKRFWQEYLPAKSRRWAINQGEIKLSKAALPLARDVEIIFQPEALRPALAAMSLAELTELFQLLPRRSRVPRPPSDLPHRALIDELLRRIRAWSQIHSGGFLFRRFAESPLLKRDLVFRQQFTAEEFESLLSASPSPEHVEEIRKEIRRRGAGNRLPLLQRIKYFDGQL
jgi:lipopolysaccharide biosynthesis protein